MDQETLFKQVKAVFHSHAGQHLDLDQAPDFVMDGEPVTKVAATLSRFAPLMKNFGSGMFLEHKDGSIGRVTTISPQGVRVEWFIGAQDGWDWFHETTDLAQG